MRVFLKLPKMQGIRLRDIQTSKELILILNGVFWGDCIYNICIHIMNQTA